MISFDVPKRNLMPVKFKPKEDDDFDILEKEKKENQMAKFKLKSNKPIPLIIMM